MSITEQAAVFNLRGLEFGHPRGPLRTFGWAPGSLDYLTRDLDRPGVGGMVPGRDVRRGRSWEIWLRTLADDRDAAGAHDLVAALAAVWHSDDLSTGEDVSLRYLLAGRWRRVYGRPRRFVLPSTDVMVRQGRADVTVTFDLTDPLHYSEDEQRVPLGIVPASSAQLRFPTAPPFRWTSEGEQTVRGATVGGDAATPMTVRFFGPVSRPWVRVGGVLVQVLGDVAYDQVLELDARRLLITVNGVPTPGMLSPATRFADLRLAPGVHEVVYGGTDVTGTSRVEVAWRDAWRSL
jgi:hypothetical protein